MINRVRNSLVGLALCGALLSGAFLLLPKPKKTSCLGPSPRLGRRSARTWPASLSSFSKKLADKDVYFSPDDAYMFFEGNNCDATQQFVGSLWTTDQNVPPGSPYAVNAKKAFHGWKTMRRALSLSSRRWLVRYCAFMTVLQEVPLTIGPKSISSATSQRHTALAALRPHVVMTS